MAARFHPSRVWRGDHKGRPDAISGIGLYEALTMRPACIGGIGAIVSW
jgi:hypothetical protein